MKNVAMYFLKVTEAAAIESSDWIGRGNKNDADGAATSAMRRELNQMDINGTIVIGEGELDEAPMLYIDEKVGTGRGPHLDIAVDPVEGTCLVAGGEANSVSVIAVAPRGSLLHAPDMYMSKLVVGHQARGCIRLEDSLTDNIKRCAKALNKRISDFTVAIQNRERHQSWIQEVQAIGARVHLFADGDVMFAAAAAIDDSPIDMAVGIGGAPEGVLSAVAVTSLGGDMQCKLLPREKEEYERCVRMGITNPNQVLLLHDIVRSEHCLFAATGITDGILLNVIKFKGSRTGSEGKITHSLLTCGTNGAAYFIKTVYQQSKIS